MAGCSDSDLRRAFALAQDDRLVARSLGKVGGRPGPQLLLPLLPAAATAAWTARLRRRPLLLLPAWRDERGDSRRAAAAFMTTAAAVEYGWLPTGLPAKSRARLAALVRLPGRLAAAWLGPSPRVHASREACSGQEPALGPGLADDPGAVGATELTAPRPWGTPSSTASPYDLYVNFTLTSLLGSPPATTARGMGWALGELIPGRLYGVCPEPRPVKPKPVVG